MEGAKLAIDGHAHKPKIRLADVAERAKVSVASVSRVVRGVSRVDTETRQKVETALAALHIDKGYFSNKLTDREGFQFVALCIRDLLSPFSGLLLKGIQEVAYTHRYGIMLCDGSDDNSQYEQINRLVRQHNGRGVIFASTEQTSLVVEKLLADKTPLVLMDGVGINRDACSVTNDNRGGACNAVRYLISLGHRRILYLAGDHRLTTETERYAGYCDALKDAGIPLDPRLRVEGFFDWQRSHDSIASIIDEHVEFTAIFCANDLMAFAAKYALEEHGLQVPQDVSLMGFDDIPLSAPLSLTTYSLPAYEMGRNAMQMLIDLVEGRITLPKQLVLHPTIRIRNSCKRIDRNSKDTIRGVAAGRTIRVGFTPPADTEFYEIIRRGAYTMMKELTDRSGVKFEFTMAAPIEHRAVESQVSIIEDWAAKSFDAILVCSSGEFETLNPLFRRVMDKGTAIYMFNMPAELSKESDLRVVSFVGYDNHYQAGYLVGKYAADKLGKRGKILLVWGLRGTGPLRGRADSWKQSGLSAGLRSLAKNAATTFVMLARRPLQGCSRPTPMRT